MALRSEDEQRLLFDTQSLGRYVVKRELELRHFFDLPRWFVTDFEAGWQGQVFSAGMRLRLGYFLPKFGVNDGNFSAHLISRQAGYKQRLMVLDGYFQRNWLWPMFNEVRRELAARLRSPVASGGPALDFDCLLHIRGSDFLTSEQSKVVDSEFYIRGLELLRKRAFIGSAYVVTDDVPYATQVLASVRERVPDLRLFIPDQPFDMFYDFMNIRNARCRVIGNSTFSWWAAALDPKEAITVAPMQWSRGLDRNLVLPWEILLEV